VLATSLLAASVRAETHTISFDNQCGYGTPYLIVGGQTVSTGEPYTSDGPISSSIAYLQTGDCEYNGENCMIIEMTLVNPTAPGTGSSSDISLIDPHTYNVQGSFSYYNGCPNTGANCASADCSTAFFYSDDTTVQVACEDNDVCLCRACC
ncbi:glycopeptide, partial [Laetiporus sulphureus 93-53]